MSDERSLYAAMWIMIVVQTFGSVDMPGAGPRKMPPPRAYVPVVVGFGILNIVADAGAGRTAKVMGWLTVLAAIVLGPFGTKLSNLFTTVSSDFTPTVFAPSTPQG